MSESANPVCRLVTDPSFTILECDPAFEETFGFDATGQEFARFISPKDRRGSRDFVNATTRYTEGLIDLTLTLRLEEQPRLCRVRARRDGERWFVFIEDLLAAPGDAFFALLEGAERWRALIKQSEDGVAILDAEHRIIEFNEQFLRLGAFASEHGVALNEESLQGRVLFELEPEDLDFQEMGTLVEQSRAKKRKRFRGVLRRANCWVQMTTSAIHLPVHGFCGTCVILNDVTAQKMLEQASEALQRKHNDIQAMLQNLKQGIFTMVEGETVHPEYSRFLEDILGVSELAGRDVFALLFETAILSSDELASIEAVLRTTVGVDMLFFDLNAALLPREIERRDSSGEVKILELDWVPLHDASEEIQKLLITVRDVTELRRLEHEQRRQSEELSLISDLVKLSTTDLCEFLDASRDMLADVRQNLSTERPSHETLARIFRGYHTIKGNSRFRGLGLVSTTAHDAETRLAELRDDEALAWEQGSLLEDLDALERVLSRYEHVNDKVLGRSQNVASSTPGVLVYEPNEVLELLLDLDKIEQDPSRASWLRASVLERASVPLDVALQPVVAGLSRVAEKVSKPMPEIQIEASIGIASFVLRPLQDVFIHLLTNALDHGIEAPEVRAARGVSRRGAISVRVREVPGGVDVVVRDDGPGLAVDALRHRDGYQDATDEELLECVFASGVSTKQVVTMTSGRGVGMNAAREMARAWGGDLTIAYVGEASGASELRRIPLELCVHMPESVLWSRPRDTRSERGTWESTANA